MSAHFQREIEILKKKVLELAALVESQVEKSVGAFLEPNEEVAQVVEVGDVEIDRLEIEVEEECLKLMALYQPVAIDLRLIVAILKINNDLERIGDLAVNIAHKTHESVAPVFSEYPFDILKMAAAAQAMLDDALESLVNMDVATAEAVCNRDDAVDAMKRDIRKNVEKIIVEKPERIKPLLKILAVSRNLERVADCAANIAEDVIYMISGRIVRHAMKDE